MTRTNEREEFSTDDSVPLQHRRHSHEHRMRTTYRPHKMNMITSTYHRVTMKSLKIR